MDFTTGSLTGRVIAVGVSGAGRNSGQLQFSILSEGAKSTYVMNMDYRGQGNADESTEPQVFTTAAAILLKALDTKLNVFVAWRVPVGVSITPMATEVSLRG